MARSVTLATLESRVLRRANLEGAMGPNSFITQAELDDAINESLAELYDLLRAGYGQDYFVNTSTFNTTANTASYALPGDFMSMLGVDITFGQNLVITGRPYMWTERNRYKWYPGWIYSQPVFYRIIGGNITFIPSPGGSFSVTLNYVPAFQSLTLPGSTFDGVAGWEEYAVLDAAIKLLIKDGDPDMIGVLQGRLAQMKQRIDGLAAQRDAGAPERVQDVTLNDGWIGRPGWE